MLRSLLSRKSRTHERRKVQRSSTALLDVNPIRKRVDSLRKLSDADLSAAASDLRETASIHKTAEHDLASFALATEAVRRTTGKTYYDVQLQAGDVLARGDLAEMQTGEGKTLVTVLPVISAVLANQNVHVATTNSYLAERDCAELRPSLELLGLTVGLLPEENDEAAKRAAYSCDVTYGTGYEFGFDYLRDQLTLRQQPHDRLGDSWLRSLADVERPKPDLVQSARLVSVVDEIDSVLIDEANTPLVISFFCAKTVDIEPYRYASTIAKSLEADLHYHVDRAAQRLTLSRAGLDRIEQSTQTSAELQRPWRIYVEQALRASLLLQRDIDYVIQDDKVSLVDQQTGRIFPERKWRDGLHQAIEFHEQVELTPETNSFARISRQRFFKQYEQATGMTGTAMDAVDEFHGFFGLNVVQIPLNRPSRRVGLPSRCFGDVEAKLAAIVTDVQSRHRAGQPVLIGTRTIEQSVLLSDLLVAAGVPHDTLNGIQDSDEAAIVACAGKCGAVTVATNMAGRGTDIKLSQRARERGGLHVIAAEPNRSRRVDRQLVGRGGRQGDPGSCQVFVSADDELLESVGRGLAGQIRRAVRRSGEADVNVDKDLRALQRKAERNDYARRKHLMQQEMWVEGVLQTLVGEGATG